MTALSGMYLIRIHVGSWWFKCLLKFGCSDSGSIKAWIADAESLLRLCLRQYRDIVCYSFVMEIRYALPPERAGLSVILTDRY